MHFVFAILCTGTYHTEVLLTLSCADLMANFIGAPPGLIQKTAEPMIDSIAMSLGSLVRADSTFKCLINLAPLAMSIMPALLKGAHGLYLAS
jgi:hypothetical protein